MKKKCPTCEREVLDSYFDQHLKECKGNNKRESESLSPTTLKLIIAVLLIVICLGFGYFLFNSNVTKTLERKPNPEKTQQLRQFYPHQATTTNFSYQDKLGLTTSWYRMMKIATGAEIKFSTNNKLIYRSSLVAMDTKDKLQDEMTLTFKSEYLKDNAVMFTFEVVRDFSSGTVNTVTIEGKYRSVYTYPNGRRELPLITTTDLSSGKIVSETKNAEFAGDGSFRVEEINYKNVQEIFRSVVRRYAGTGMFVDEIVKNGTLDTDYHHYELLLGNWSLGRG